MFRRWFFRFVLVIPWLLALGIGFLLVTKHLPADGQTILSAPLDGSSPWLYAFLPEHRVTRPQKQVEGWTGQIMHAEPIYASAPQPGAYESVEIELEARPENVGLLELGLLRNPFSQQYEMKPVWNSELAEGWKRVHQESGVEGYVKNEFPDEILEAEDLEELMIWYASGTSPERMDPVTDKRQTHDISLRGGHDFHVIPVGGVVDFFFDLQDMNRNMGEDIITWRLTKNDVPIWSDATTLAYPRTAQPPLSFEKKIKVSDLEPGVYRLSMAARDDIFIRRITTTAKHWIIGPRVYFADQVGYRSGLPSVDVWTNSRHLSLETFHKEGLQRVYLGSSSTTITKTHQPFSLSWDFKEKIERRRLRAPRGDVRLVGDGYVALTSEALFLPQPRRLLKAEDLRLPAVKALRTTYQSPEQLGDGWVRLRAQFSLTKSADPLKFVLSAPDLKEGEGRVFLRAARLTYVRPRLSWREFQRVFRREGRIILRRF